MTFYVFKWQLLPRLVIFKLSYKREAFAFKLVSIHLFLLWVEVPRSWDTVMLSREFHMQISIQQIFVEYLRCT